MKSRYRDVFTTVRTEGGLLPADLLQRIADGDPRLGGLEPEAYGLAPGEKLNEAINRSWNRLRGVWSGFREAVAELPPTDAATTQTRQRWLRPLFQELGYGTLTDTASVEVEGRTYPVYHAAGRTSVHLVGCGVDLDDRKAGVAGAARTSPHSLQQELLNRSDEFLWGIVSNGLRLRLLRDNASLTRQAYVEFDLQAMMDGEVYADFALLWLLCHKTRIEAAQPDPELGELAGKPERCWLERWSRLAQDQGKRALDELRRGVEAAISALGEGFLCHRANEALRERLRSGALSTRDYYRQLLRLVYRLLFLFVAEGRDLLLLADAPEEAKQRYLSYYSLARLRTLCERRRGTRHSDLYAALRLVLRLLGTDEGCPALALPALGSFLFREEAVPDLGTAEVDNQHLLDAIRALAFVQDGPIHRPVDYRNLGSEELGGVFESLLELHPELYVPEVGYEAGRFELKTAAGNERKTSGSYYTPESLVQCLLDSALNPLLDEACRKPDPEKALLDLKVVDPACGSGHFLVAAAHRIAKRLAAIRTGDEEPAPTPYREALREVVGKCLYGVDVNPMAVELCKVALWMEALVPGKSLPFLNHHIQEGNSLLGATPRLLKDGIPDAAFAPIQGDDPKFCSDYRRQNAKERVQLSLLDRNLEPWEQLGNLAVAMVDLDRSLGETVPAERSREEDYERHVRSTGYLFNQFLADVWCATFVWKKQKTDELPYPITEELFRRIERTPHAAPVWVREEVERLRREYSFFHWHLAFPGVFRVPSKEESPENNEPGWSGGFHLVLGNPPWERVKLQEQEFFASRNGSIATAPNAAARQRIIAALPATDPMLWEKWCEASRVAQGQSHFARNSGRYPLCGRGDVNVYALFAEHNWHIVGPTGRAGFIVPSGIATDETTKDYFHALIVSGVLRSLWEFENVGFFTAGKGHMLRFALTTLSRRREPNTRADFMFQGQKLADLDDPSRHFTLTVEDIATVNPNTGTCPIFRTQRDAAITLAIYRRAGVLWREDDPDGNPWGLRFMAMFHMANDSRLFRTRSELIAADWELDGNRFVRGSKVMLPLYEAKMAYIYNHRSGTFEGTAPGDRAHRLPTPSREQLADPKYAPLPFYWVAQDDVEARLDGVWHREWLLGWRDVTDARASARTVVFCVLPRVGVGHKMPMAFPSVEPRLIAAMYANLSSLVLDYAARQKVGGLSLTYFILKQLPVLSPAEFTKPCRWDTSRSLRDWLLPRVLELTYTAWDLKQFAEDCADLGPPFTWDAERRFRVQCEIDAAFFHVYEVCRNDVAYILDTFPVLMRAEERSYGEFRTKRTVLEIYDALAGAMRTGGNYSAPLPAARRIS